MNDSADNSTPRPKPKQREADLSETIKRDVTSLSEWAEFSLLIQRLDDEYAETVAAPLAFRVENPKPIDS
jgi:hypothetical protein